jgi:hypothetical protein
LSSVEDNPDVMESKLSTYYREFGLTFLFPLYNAGGSSSKCEEINVLAKNIGVEALKTPELRCFPLLMRVGAMPCRVAPGQGGLWEMMKSCTLPWVALRRV